MPHAKLQNPRTTPSVIKVTQGERKEREKKSVVNGVHYVLPETPKGSAGTLLGPIMPLVIAITFARQQHLKRNRAAYALRSGINWRCRL